MSQKYLVEDPHFIDEINEDERKKLKYTFNDEQEFIITEEFLNEFIEHIKSKAEIIYKNKLNIDCEKLAKNSLIDLKHQNKWSDIKDVIIGISNNLCVEHYDYDKLAVFIIVNDLHKTMHHDYAVVVELLHEKQHKNAKYALISDEYYDFAKKHLKTIQEHLDYSRDYKYNYLGLKTILKSYLKRDKKGNLIELPQHYIMRVALSIHMQDNQIDKAMETYHYMSNFYFTHATPTLFNSGTAFAQMSSCFLLSGGIKDLTKTDLSFNSFKNNNQQFCNDLLFNIGKFVDKYKYPLTLTGIGATLIPFVQYTTLPLAYFLYNSLKVYQDRVNNSYDSDDMRSIGNTWRDVAVISKHAGGIGISVADIRASGSYITSTQGKSSGYKMINVFNDIARYADQGGKRPGAFAIYTEPWHADIEYFLRAKLPTGDDNEKALDLFYGLWICDIFMERVKNNQNWSLMCPHECPGLTETYGEEFEKLYLKYESEGRARKTIKAVELWKQILYAHQMTGVPYMLFKDHVNHKNNQKNLGTIKCSNLCTEITEYSNPTEYAVCNLASICLPAFVKNGKYDFDKLKEISSIIAVNLDKIIDANYYPVEQTYKSNMKNRPIGIGVQGLADTFILMKMPFDSPEARQLNKEIFETIYYGAMEASINRARVKGAYPSFKGSYFSEGKFQFDLWGVKPEKWDWETLRKEMLKYGVRNSLLTAPMPTASTSKIMGYNECFEPFASNIFRKETSAGHFTVFNEYMMKDLMDLGLWNEEMRDKLKLYDGSIQEIDEIPKDVRKLYKTVWEIPTKVLIDLSADRGAYVDQSQSLNLFIANPNYQNITDALFYGWKRGLKTGMYYLRSKPASNGMNYGLDIEKEKQLKEENKGKICKWKPGMKLEDCESCSA